MIRSTLSLLFLRLDKPSFPKLYPRGSLSVFCSSLWLFFEPSPACPHLFWIEGTKTEHSTVGVAWQWLSGMGWWLVCLLVVQPTQPPAALLCCSSGTVLTHMDLVTPQVPLHRALLQLGRFQLCCTPGLGFSQVQDLGKCLSIWT